MSSSSCHIKAGEPPSSVSNVYFSYLLVRKDLVAVTTLCFACKNELLALCNQRRSRLKDAEGLCIWDLLNILSTRGILGSRGENVLSKRRLMGRCPEEAWKQKET